MTTQTRLQYRLLMAVDIERYSGRSARRQLMVQSDLRRVLDQAAARTGLDRDGWQRQPRGDGELAVLPQDVEIPKAVGALPAELAAALADLNRGRPDEERLRIRLAFHHGTLTPGPFGPAGDAPIVVSRLLDAAPLRRLLSERQDRHLALIVSDSLYNDVVSTGFCALDPSGFQSVGILVKGIRYRGFACADTESAAEIPDNLIDFPAHVGPAQSPQRLSRLPVG
ncbi:hypothetical protein [Actinomadura rubrisoli]|uniref:Uncharacterized protein n=1 Tax=Actinomadura rubrisoli TaxID=2530368 RepID=A0A4R5C3M8_9ACTN|nr:hypothetical protein [Actinomadura rubrisoli]TDD93006.1 hypothetical protein E1298_10345 [Actinomadura rubrisoli]